MNKISRNPAKAKIYEIAKIKVANAGSPTQAPIISMFAEASKKIEKKH